MDMSRRRPPPRPAKLFHAIVVCGVSLTACGGRSELGSEVVVEGADAGPAVKDAGQKDSGEPVISFDSDVPDTYRPPVDAGPDGVVVIRPPPPIR